MPSLNCSERADAEAERRLLEEQGWTPEEIARNNERATPAEVEQIMAEVTPFVPQVTTKEAGHVMKGDEIMLPGDIAGTVQNLEVIEPDWVVFHTDMGNHQARFSDPITVLPPAPLFEGNYRDQNGQPLQIGDVVTHNRSDGETMIGEIVEAEGGWLGVRFALGDDDLGNVPGITSIQPNKVRREGGGPGPVDGPLPGEPYEQYIERAAQEAQAGSSRAVRHHSRHAGNRTDRTPSAGAGRRQRGTH